MSYSRYDVAVRVFLAVALLALLVTATAVTDNVSAEKKVGYLCRPSVVMVKTEYYGDFLDDYGSSLVYLYPDGGPEDGVPVTIPQLSTGSLGSGFIVSQDGYIVTNAHVVNTPDDQLKAEFAQEAVSWAIDEWPAVFEYYGDDPYPATEDDLDYLFNLFMSYKLDYLEEIRVYFGGTSSTLTTPAGYPAEIRKISPQKLWFGSGDYKYRSGKDIAIIKIEGLSNLPIATLGDSDEVEIGDKVIVIGYPGVTTSWMNIALSSETDYIPTVTSGIIGAKRKLPDGSDTFQTDAMIYHGNSGGPAFNEDGRVIGITTFGSGRFMESGEWLDVLGYDFLIPINVAKSFVTELNINTTPGMTAEHFEKGLEFYWNDQYSLAEQEFQDILTLNPGNLYATEYARMSRLR